MVSLPLPANSLYGNEPVDIFFPDDWEVAVSEISGAKKQPLSPSALSGALRNPVGCQPVHKAAKGCKTAVIIFDDNTRPTPLEEIGAILIEELMAAGVARDHIYFMCAVGMHRAMGREDYVRKLGSHIVDHFRIYSHNPFMEGAYIGDTTHGLRVEVNQDIVRADYKIAVGTFMPHSLYGFSGGGKMILPGIATAETIRQNHLTDDVTTFSLAKLDTVNRDNSMQAAKMLPLDMKIDCLLNASGEISDVFAGEAEAVVRQAVPVAERHYAARFIADADVVVANNYFKPTEANTAYTPRSLESLNPKGGDYILSAHTPQGFAPHYLYSRWGFSEVGGTLWSGEFRKKRPIHRLIGFTTHMDWGMSESWFAGRDEIVFKKCWSDVLTCIDHHTPRRVAVYPFACTQII